MDSKGKGGGGMNWETIDTIDKLGYYCTIDTMDKIDNQCEPTVQHQKLHSVLCGGLNVEEI